MIDYTTHAKDRMTDRIGWEGQLPDPETYPVLGAVTDGWGARTEYRTLPHRAGILVVRDGAVVTALAWIGVGQAFPEGRIPQHVREDLYASSLVWRSRVRSEILGPVRVVDVAPSERDVYTVIAEPGGRYGLAIEGYHTMGRSCGSPTSWWVWILRSALTWRGDDTSTWSSLTSDEAGIPEERVIPPEEPGDEAPIGRVALRTFYGGVRKEAVMTACGWVAIP